MQVQLREGETFEGMLKRFKTGVMHAGIMQEYKRHSVYIPPSEKRRRKAEQARRRHQRARHRMR